MWTFICVLTFLHIHTMWILWYNIDNIGNSEKYRNWFLTSILCFLQEVIIPLPISVYWENLTLLYSICKHFISNVVYALKMACWYIYMPFLQTWRTHLWTWGEDRREKGSCTERLKWKLTIPHVKQIARGNLPCDSGNSNRGSVTGWRLGWAGRWEGGAGRREHGYSLWLLIVAVWQKTTTFCKAIILQLKN